MAEKRRGRDEKRAAVLCVFEFVGKRPDGKQFMPTLYRRGYCRLHENPVAVFMVSTNQERKFHEAVNFDAHTSVQGAMMRGYHTLREVRAEEVR